MPKISGIYEVTCQAEVRILQKITLKYVCKVSDPFATEESHLVNHHQISYARLHEGGIANARSDRSGVI